MFVYVYLHICIYVIYKSDKEVVMFDQIFLRVRKA